MKKCKYDHQKVFVECTYFKYCPICGELLKRDGEEIISTMSPEDVKKTMKQLEEKING